LCVCEFNIYVYISVNKYIFLDMYIHVYLGIVQGARRHARGHELRGGHELRVGHEVSGGHELRFIHDYENTNLCVRVCT